MNNSYADYLTHYFYAWETRGRGHSLWRLPVELEPDYIPFHWPELGSSPLVDDGFRHSALSYLESALTGRSKQVAPTPQIAAPEEVFPLNPYLVDKPYFTRSVLRISLPKDLSINPSEAEQLLVLLSGSKHQISFEVIGFPDRIDVQFTCHPDDEAYIESQLRAYYPRIIILPEDNTLLYRWEKYLPDTIIEFGLQEEFMRPLNTSMFPDVLSGIIGVMEYLKDQEIGMLQVLFQGAHSPWTESILESVTDGAGGSFFTDSPEMLPLAREKVSRPLFGVVIRVIGKAATRDRANDLAFQLVDTLLPMNRPRSNSIDILSNRAYQDWDMSTDVLSRTSRRLGMLLNSAELAALVHLPSQAVVSAKLRGGIKKTKQAPLSTEGQQYIIGENDHASRKKPVGISIPQRLRHMHVIGATGTGKSTMLLDLIVQDIEAGHGVTVLDPHGDLIDSIMSHVPDERLADVILVDPSDSEYPVGLNLLQANSEVEKIVLSSDLVAMFKRFATSWGDQMSSVLANAIDAILESDQGGTLLDLRRFLVEKDFRKQFLTTVQDPEVKYYWTHEFPMLRSNSIAPLVTRLSTFLRPKLVRYMMAQRKGLDFSSIMNEQKVLLVKLSQGFIGEENSYLLGTLIVAKLQQAAQGRQALAKSERSPFFLYIDEFQNFITPSLAGILSGARKYGLGLILAHQDMQQVIQNDQELASSVIANPGTRICFRLGDQDAKKLEAGFSFFEATDLLSLGVGEAIAKVERADHDFNLLTKMRGDVPATQAEQRRKTIILQTRNRYASTRADVERDMRRRHESPIIHDVEFEDVPEEVAPPRIKEPKEKPIPEPPVPPTPDESLEVAAEEFKRKAKAQAEIREHVHLQNTIKQLAHSRGYVANIEEPTSDGGRVDVGLELEKTKIACEISVTTPANHEADNLVRRLVDYDFVIMCSRRTEHLQKIKNLTQQAVSAKDFERIFFFSPEEAMQYLEEFAVKQASTEKRIKGYRVKTNFETVDQKESKAIQTGIAEVVMEALRRSKKRGDGK